MTTLMIIETTHGGMFFSLTYLAAFLVTAGTMIHVGFKKDYPRSTWLLIILSGVIFFIIGDKVFTWSPEQWTQVFTRFHFPDADKKTVLGGIVGLLTGIFLAKIWLRFNRPVLDTLAIALPLSMAISRIGCLMAGCCFGTPTNLPWGIQYDAASSAYHVHLVQGLVHPHDVSSLAVHPAQIYQVIGCLFIAFIVWKSRKQWKSSGSLFLFSVLCYGVLRFFVEFVRAPESNFFTGQFFWGLKVIQWLIMGAILPGFSILAFRESMSKPFSGVFRPVHVSDLRQVLLTIFLSVVVFTGRKWFDQLEISTILVFLMPVIIALSVKMYRKYSVAGFRWVVPVMFVCCLSFMAQKSSPTGKEDDNITFTSVGLTGMAGTYYEMFEKVSKEWIPASSGSCGNIGTPGHWSARTDKMGMYKNTFWQGGLDISYNKWMGKYYKFMIGGKAFLGDESGSIKPVYPTSTSFGVSPYVWFDWRWVGFGGGFTVGQMKLPLGHRDIYTYNNGDVISSDYRNFYIFPSIGFRVGPSDLVYVEARAPALFPSSSPFFAFQAGLGSGLGKTNGTKVGIGYCQGIYAQLVYPVKNLVVLEAMYGDNLQTGMDSKRIFSFGIHYRFSFKTIPSYPLQYNSGVKFHSSRDFSKLRETVMDIDGNVYHTLALGGQVWMAENLKVTRYHDGSLIPGISENVPGFGLQYNWFAVNHSGNLCPVGWHVPSLSEWTSLINSLGGKDVAGSKLEEGFSSKGKISQWWSSTEQDTLHAQSFYLNNQTIGIMFTGSAKTSALYVRCIRN